MEENYEHLIQERTRPVCIQDSPCPSHKKLSRKIYKCNDNANAYDDDAEVRVTTITPRVFVQTSLKVGWGQYCKTSRFFSVDY